jgi:hypothetical protein
MPKKKTVTTPTNYWLSRSNTTKCLVLWDSYFLVIIVPAVHKRMLQCYCVISGAIEDKKTIFYYYRKRKYKRYDRIDLYDCVGTVFVRLCCMFALLMLDVIT